MTCPFPPVTAGTGGVGAVVVDVVVDDVVVDEGVDVDDVDVLDEVVEVVVLVILDDVVVDDGTAHSGGLSRIDVARYSRPSSGSAITSPVLVRYSPELSSSVASVPSATEVKVASTNA